MQPPNLHSKGHPARLLDDKGQEHTIAFGIEDWWIADFNSYFFRQSARLFVEALKDSTLLQIEYHAEQELLNAIPKFEKFYRIISQNGYALSKHTVDGLSKAAALETATAGICVNAVAPGPVDTSVLTRFTGTDDRKTAVIAGVPMKRMGLPGEIARAIVFFGFHKSPFLTGQIIAVDGGKLA